MEALLFFTEKIGIILLCLLSQRWTNNTQTTIDKKKEIGLVSYLN